MNTYQPSEFLQRLAADDLPDHAAVTIAGLVKYNTQTTDVIDFSTSMSCTHWLTIPVSMIEDITHLQNAKCDDHQHPVVEIRLKEPPGERTDLHFLFGLVAELQNTVARLTRSPSSTGRVTPYDFTDCYTVIDNGKVKVCCGDPPECTGVALRM